MKMAKDRVNIYGVHAVCAVCKHYPELVYQIFVGKQSGDGKASVVYALAKQHDIPLQQSSKSQLDNLSDGGVHQGVIAVCRAPETASMQDLEKIIANSECPLLLLLDCIQDPHNLGACLRSANAMGVDAVIAPKHDSCGYTPVVHKVSCGASLLTPFIRVGNLARTIDYLAKQGVWLVGMDAETDHLLLEVDLKGPIALVMGAEGRGLRRLTKDKCDYLAKLPMRGDVESLNVSVATGMALYEVLRQRIL